MNFFRLGKIDVDKFLKNRRFQDVYGNAMRNNLLFATTVTCGGMFQQLDACVREKGPDACEQESMMAISCAASVFAPAEYQKLGECLDAGGVCDDEVVAAVTKSEQVAELESRKMQKLDNNRDVEELVRCGFFTHADQSPEEQNIVAECYTRALCKNQMEKFLDCVGKNGNDYGASSCAALGDGLASCLGEKLSNGVMKAQMRGDMQMPPK